MGQVLGAGDNHDFPSAFFCPSADKVRRGTLLCFRISPVSIKVMDKRVWVGGGLSRFSVSIVLSQSAERARSGILQCPIISGYTKNLCIRKICHDLLVKIFCLAVSRKLVGGDPSVFQKFSGIENFLDKKVGWGGVTQFFRWGSLVAQCRKTS